MSRPAFLLLAVLVALLTAPTVTRAAEPPPTLEDLESEIMCPICNTTLELSNSPAANQIRREIERGIAAGQTESRIKADLVAQFGPAVLAAPPTEGFNLLAWLLPLAGGLVAVVGLGLAARRWRGARGPRESAEPATEGPARNGRARVADRDLEQRLDEELARFDA
jgi:cytochrome c-type biogenesis protein CcmH